MLLCQGAASAHKRSRGVRLPAHFGHDFLQGYTAFAFEQLDNVAPRHSSPFGLLCAPTAQLHCPSDPERVEGPGVGGVATVR